QPSKAFENFWYFWIVYVIKEEQFNSITVRAFEKTLTLEKNSEALGKCFELIIQSIRYQPLAQEPLETLLTDLERTSRRTFQKSSNASKMDGDTFHIGTSTSGRRIPENQADPHREWAAILNNILSDQTNLEDKDLTITEYDNIYQNDQNDEDPETTWNIKDITFSPIRNVQERRNIYQNTTDNRREDTDNREEQRKPEGRNDVITQFLQGFGDLLKTHTVTPHLIKRLDPQGMRQEVDKIAEFIKGLRSEFIVTVDEAINKALALETAYSIGMELSAYSMIPNYLQGMSGGFIPVRTTLFMSKLEEQNKPNNNSNSNNKSNNRDTRTCHKCSKVKYIARDCRSGQRNNNNYNNNINNSNNNNNNNNTKTILRRKSANKFFHQSFKLVDTPLEEEIREFEKKDYEDEYIIVDKLPDDDELVDKLELLRTNKHWKGPRRCLCKTLLKEEDCSYCKVLHQDLQKYQIAVSINKAQIEASDKLMEISKGKETPIGNLTKDQQ
ncbi:796_t:CDS:2, partial [Funneliformis caledonium]